MKKIVSGFMILLVAVCMLFAAGGKESEKKSGITTVRIALWDYEAAGSVYPQLFAEFEKANPDIKIEVISSPSGDYETKLTTMLASGTI